MGALFANILNTHIIIILTYTYAHTYGHVRWMWKPLGTSKPCLILNGIRHHSFFVLSIYICTCVCCVCVRTCGTHIFICTYAIYIHIYICDYNYIKKGQQNIKLVANQKPACLSLISSRWTKHMCMLVCSMWVDRYSLCDSKSKSKYIHTYINVHTHCVF